MDRVNGFIEALKRYPDITIVADSEYSDDEEKAYHVVEDIISRYPDLDGIFSNSATGSAASGKYVFDHPEQKRPVLIGYDVTESVEEYLQQGIFDMVIDQEPRRQSYHAIMLMYKHLTEKWLPEEQKLEIRVNMVMRHNADQHSMRQVLNHNIIR